MARFSSICGTLNVIMCTSDGHNAALLSVAVFKTSYPLFHIAHRSAHAPVDSGFVQSRYAATGQEFLLFHFEHITCAYVKSRLAMFCNVLARSCSHLWNAQCRVFPKRMEDAGAVLSINRVRALVLDDIELVFAWYFCCGTIRMETCT